MKEEENIIIQYNTYNARYLSFEEVAESFIPNQEFYKLLKNDNSLLMGPRGSGKTTLMKMITPGAIYNWNSTEAKEIHKEIPFFGIYIPSDIQWMKQIQSLEKKLGDNKDISKSISRMLVNTNILISACKTFTHLLLKIPIEGKLLSKLESFIKDLIKFWNIPKPIPLSIDAIVDSLHLRIKEVNTTVNKIVSENLHFNQIEKPNYFYEEFFDLLVLACNSFENHFKDLNVFNSNYFRWALCFDELEIAPEWLQLELLGFLRSRNQKFLFKLATTPLVSLYDSTNKKYFKIDAQLDNDYKIIRTWLSSRTDEKNWESFCNNFVSSLIAKKFNFKIHPLEVFGHYNDEKTFYENEHSKFQKAKSKSVYEKYSAFWIIMRELAIKDNSFNKFLLSKGIRPENPITKQKAIEDSVLRKIKPIVIFRYYFKKPEEKLRSRKITALYYGLPNIYHICDGNPRTIINLVTEIYPYIKIKNDCKVNEVSISNQARVAQFVSETNFEIFSNHPDANIVLNNTRINLGEVLTHIGKYFFNKIVTNPFTMDPLSVFIIDEKVDAQLIVLLKFALNVGAILHLEPQEGLLNEQELRNKKFRLSYILHPLFKLPIREYHTINLSTILMDFLIQKNNIQKSKDQFSLFNK